VLISIGGWSWSEQFSNVALTEASRQKFVQACIKLYFQKYTGVFDGVDIDWEYPVGGGLKPGRPADKRNFTLLLAEFRKQLDALGKPDGDHALLTIAAPASPGAYANIELEQIHPYLDWINRMTYDFHGAWDAVTNFNSPLYKSSSDTTADPIVRDRLNVHAAVQAYLKAGISSKKLIVGVPFYGRGWQGVSSRNYGLYQAATGPAQGIWETGVYDYTDIVKNYLPTYTRSWQAEAKVPWLYNPATGVMIAYEDPESVSVKADYVKEHSLGGIMSWELSNDGGVLLKTIYDRLYR
jgi:chitinase